MLDDPTEHPWENDALARVLESRLAGFWNPDYLQRIVLPLLNLKPGARILDAGSGNGSLSFLLARFVPDAQIIGVDITPKLVTDAQTQAAALGLTNVEFYEGDVFHLQFADASFDAAVCQTLLIHLTDPAGAVREMCRVLSPGGRLLAAEYYTLNMEWPIDRQRPAVTDTEAADCARYTQMILNGFRNSGQGDLRSGGQVPFLAVEAGMEIVDVRINDRVPHAFPPYDKPMQRAARAQAQGTVATFADTQWRAWLTNVMISGGGSAADADGFLSMLPERQRASLASRADYSFLWLMNPVLLLTIAQKL
jgi:SAM-dependent methyltransferase